MVWGMYKRQGFLCHLLLDEPYTFMRCWTNFQASSALFQVNRSSHLIQCLSPNSAVCYTGAIPIDLGLMSNSNFGSRMRSSEV